MPPDFGKSGDEVYELEPVTSEPPRVTPPAAPPVQTGAWPSPKKTADQEDDEDEASDQRPIVSPGGIPARYLTAAGIGFTIAAVTGTIILYSESKWLSQGVLTLYRVAAHSVAAGLALAAVAALLGKRLGSIPDASARMFSIIAFMMAVMHVTAVVGGITIAWLAAIAAYALSLWGLFRWEKETLFLVAGTNFVLSIFLELGMLMAQFARPEAAAAAGG